MSETTGGSRREFLAKLAMGGAGLAAAGALPAFAAPPAALAGEPLTVLAGVTLIDGGGGPPSPGSAIVLLGDRIIAAGPFQGRFPSGARVFDLRGKYVIPGLWDMHVHTVPLDRVYPPAYVVNGVTGVREMYGFFHPSLPELRDRIESGAVTGPRMVIASNIIDGPHSVHAPTGALSVTTEAEARAAVRAAKDQGADFVKVYSMLYPETFAAIADECRKAGLAFAGHVPERMPVAQASNAGMRSAEHLFGFFTATSSREEGLRARIVAEPVDPANPHAWYDLARKLEREASRSYDARRARQLFQCLRRNGTHVSPTLTVLRALSLPASGFDREDPRLRYLPKQITDYWWHQVEQSGPSTPEAVEEHRRFFEAELRMVGELHRAGVPVLAGTDANNAFCFPGFSLHEELELLVRAGLSPMRALQSATSDAARYLGLDHELGTIVPGKAADLVVLDADPLADIANTQRIHAVVTRGRFLGPRERTRLLADIEQAATEPIGPPPAGLLGGCGCRG